MRFKNMNLRYPIFFAVVGFSVGAVVFDQELKRQHRLQPGDTIQWVNSKGQVCKATITEANGELMTMQERCHENTAHF